MERRRSRRPAEAGLGVALQAQQVHIAQLQHVRIWSAMHQVAGLASINLYRLVFEHKRALLVCVAREADRILRGGRPHLLGLHRAMHVVAVAALDQTFIYAMVKRHVELGFLLEMAPEAKLGLWLHQQELRFLRVMRRVAGDATDIVFAMLRVDGIHVLRAARMALQAACVDFLCGVIRKDENLGLVAAALNVCRAGTVATFAALVRFAAFRVQSRLPVRGFFPSFINIFVAGLANVRTKVRRLAGILRSRRYF